jgi:hypothetical protein
MEGRGKPVVVGDAACCTTALRESPWNRNTVEGFPIKTTRSLSHLIATIGTDIVSLEFTVPRIMT